MRVITTTEIVRQPKTYFELAERERIAVKRGKKFINMVVNDTPDCQLITEYWIKKFFSIPEMYRCNPFEYSPSGDLYFADKRNIDRLKKSIEQAKAGKIKIMSESKQKESALFILSSGLLRSL